MRKIAIANRSIIERARERGAAVMRETKKPIEDSQDAKDEAFLVQHSSRSSSAAVTLDQVREELSAMLDSARAGSKAVEPTPHFSARAEHRPSKTR